jgi:hypothetical protein
MEAGAVQLETSIRHKYGESMAVRIKITMGGARRLGDWLGCWAGNRGAGGAGRVPGRVATSAAARERAVC